MPADGKPKRHGVSAFDVGKPRADAAVGPSWNARFAEHGGLDDDDDSDGIDEDAGGRRGKGRRGRRDDREDHLGGLELTGALQVSGENVSTERAYTRTVLTIRTSDSLQSHRCCRPRR